MEQKTMYTQADMQIYKLWRMYVKLSIPILGVIPIHKEENTAYESLPNLSEYKIFHEGKTIIENISISIFNL